MKAYIRKDKWNEFKENYSKYNFIPSAKKGLGYVKPLYDGDILICVIARTRRVTLLTGLNGESPFMEAHKDKYQDLIDDDFIEYVKGKFD